MILAILVGLAIMGSIISPLITIAFWLHVRKDIQETRANVCGLMLLFGLSRVQYIRKDGKENPDTWTTMVERIKPGYKIKPAKRIVI